MSERPFQEHDVSELDSVELMRRVAADDEQAVAELYDRFGGLVYKIAYQMMPTQADAEDAVQDIFVRLWRTAGRYDSNRAAVSTWVVIIARRRLVDRLRRAQARVKPTTAIEEKWSPAASFEPLAGMEREERVEALLQRIERLPELQRIVVKRAYFGGQTLRQIGMELDRPLGTIKSTLSRALVRLRERVEEEPVA